ncbi:MAG: potassium channel family protein [Bacteroidia bacterium]
MKGTTFAVIGVGKYGYEIAQKLAQKGAQVYAFDVDEEKIDNIKDEVAFAVTLDSTDEKALLSQKIEDVDAAIVAIGENFEAVILTAVHLQEIGVKRVIARASGKQQRMILEKIGIKEILSPEDEVAKSVVEKLINPNILSSLQLPDDYEIVEVKAPKGVFSRNIKELALRGNYRLTLIAIKREFEKENGEEKTLEQHIIGVPSYDTQILEKDTLLLFGTGNDVQRFLEINE